MLKLRHLAVLALVLAALPAAALDWSDNNFSISWGPSYKEPGLNELWTGKGTDVKKGNPIEKTTLNFTHVSGDKLGGTFFTVDMLISSKQDPAIRNPTSVGSFGPVYPKSPQGAAEVYAIYRRSWSLNKITGSKSFSFTGVRDVNIDMGIDLNTKNTDFGSEKVMPIVGAALAFEVPGFWNLGIYANKEWTHNGQVNKDVEFNVTPMIATSWGIGIGGTGLSFDGFGSVNFPKGKNGYGDSTKTEVLVQPKIVYAIGNIWGNPKAGWDVAVGWQYWLNKFGNDASKDGGSVASTPFGQLTYHL